VTFSKISYDRILGDNVNEYMEAHPKTPFHEVIDIIRDKADRDYLDQIKEQSDLHAAPKLDHLKVASQDSENV
jgi:hypothetical protein